MVVEVSGRERYNSNSWRWCLILRVGWAVPLVGINPMVMYDVYRGEYQVEQSGKGGERERH